MRKFSLSKIRNFLFPALDRELISALDRQSMRNISNVSLAVFIFETLSILAFMTIEGWKLRDSTLISLLSVGFCALFSLVGFLISSRMKSRKDLPHGAFVSFKILFYTVPVFVADCKIVLCNRQSLICCHCIVSNGFVEVLFHPVAVVITYT